VKTAINIKLFIPLACILCALIFACEFENPWMADILQEKTVKFDTNGGSSIPSQKLYAGQPVQRPANPTKTDCVFQGWYKDNVTFLEPYDFSYIPKKDMTLYAKWDDDAGNNPNITIVEITINGPVTGEIPVTTPPAGGKGYTCSSVKWDPNENPFKASTVYTAEVTVTANSGRQFTDDTVVRINGTEVDAVIQTSKTITLSYTFNATLAKTVSKIEISKQPNKQNYTHEDILDLSGLEIKLTYNDNTTDDVTFIDNTYNIIAVPANGAKLSRSTHNAQSIVVSMGSSLSVNTAKLTVDKGTPKESDFTVSGEKFQTMGSVVQLQIKPRPDKTTGAITVYYKSNATSSPMTYTGSEIITAPADIYTVTFNVAEVNDWNAATELSAGTLEINKTFTTGAALAAYLSTLSANSVTNPENIEIKVNDSELVGIANALTKNKNIYVNLSLYESVFSNIGDFIFKGCTNITSVTMPQTVTSIGKEAFFGCTNLTTVGMPQTVTSIGDYAFSGCTNLTNVDMPQTVTSIGAHAFNGCKSLGSITIPNSIIKIDVSTFASCTNLASVTIGNSVSIIERDAFFGCTKLGSIIIPSSVTSIGMQAFVSSGLLSVEFKGTIDGNSFSTELAFPGDLRAKYLAANGGAGIYTRPDTASTTWTKSP